MLDDLTSLQSQFYEDALDLLNSGEAILLALEDGNGDTEQLNALFRVFHTLKGNANMVGIESVGRLCHALESILDGVRKGTTPLEEGILQHSFEVIDLLGQIAARADAAPFDDHIAQMVGRLEEGGKRSAEKVPASEPLSDPAVSEVVETEAEAQAEVEAKDGKVTQSADFLSGKGLFLRFARSYGRAVELAGEIQFADSDKSIEQLLDLGMLALDLRDLGVQLDENELGRVAIYLEKFVTALLRLQAEYEEITFELLYVLLDEMEERLRTLLKQVPWFRVEQVEEPIQLRNLVGLEIEEEKEDVLVVELHISEEAFLRSADLFNQCRRLKEERKGPVCFLHSKPGVLAKAAQLLGQSIGAVYPDVHKDVLSGIIGIAASLS
ncbi:Hpt domain-containing protein [Sediminispirochaeta smaragdinae]|uniref:CheA signal transduction histidine kinase n=1 Tax=Sediminispirochaeta smaragdinae (strain DSM 11293 / JCM 15392 / SEBR 4228) TaxID=573413 RepID=E1R9B5_SEDSS|nr:Hpt domain-containing protein [Sediminispirochaeta smaragdinae]ADK83084.1 putative CheA signal transduction histidine kinase [Sediminispirochaeta smaragdinae DSM 11293]